MPGLFKGLKGSFKHHFVRPSNAQAYTSSFLFSPDVTHTESSAGSQPLTDSAYIQLKTNPWAANTNKNEMTFSFWMYPQKLSGETSGDHQVWWVYLPSNNSGGYGNLRIESSGIDFLLNSVRTQQGVGSINYNQWNHILFSGKISTTMVTSGYTGGTGWDSSTNRQYSPRTEPDSRIHLVINGNTLHRYMQANTSSSQQDGFFQNDFATGSGDSNGSQSVFTNNRQWGNIWIPTGTTDYNGGVPTSTDIWTSNSSEDCYFGVKPTGSNAGNGEDAFKGSIFQFWAKNQYYDLTDANNIALFYNSGSSVSSLPSNPIIFFNGGARISSGTYSVGSSEVYLNRVTASTLTTP